MPKTTFLKPGDCLNLAHFGCAFVKSVRREPTGQKNDKELVVNVLATTAKGVERLGLSVGYAESRYAGAAA